MKINNIIFDLGGVIEKIDPAKVIESFRKIGMGDPDNFFSIYRQSDICTQFEIGALLPDAFIEHINSLCKTKISSEKIINAWCANQLGVEKRTVDILKELKNRNYALYILSNTNSIHYEKILSNFNKKHNECFEKLFDKIYLSYIIEKRKPSSDSYQYLIDDGISPETSLYIDDLKENLASPNALGFTTIHHKTNSSIEYLLDLCP